MSTQSPVESRPNQIHTQIWIFSDWSIWVSGDKSVHTHWSVGRNWSVIQGGSEGQVSRINLILASKWGPGARFDGRIQQLLGANWSIAAMYTPCRANHKPRTSSIGLELQNMRSCTHILPCSRSMKIKSSVLQSFLPSGTSAHLHSEEKHHFLCKLFNTSWTGCFLWGGGS